MKAIQVDACGMLSQCVIDGSALPAQIDAVNETLGSDWYDVIRYGDGIDLFVDDEGATPRGGRTKQPFNPVLSVMVQNTGRPVLLHGPGLFLGHDEDGNPAGLTEQQVVGILRDWCTANRHDVTTAAQLLTH